MVAGKLADNSYIPTGEDGQAQREVRRTELVAKVVAPDTRYASITMTLQARRDRPGRLPVTQTTD